MPKFLGLIKSCGECPHYGYESGGQHGCKEVDQIVYDKTKIASFCPLPTYPDQIIADLDRTVRVTRDARPYNFSYIVIEHIARRFDTVMTRRGTVFTLKDGSTVSLEYDYITKIELQGTEIHFICSGDTYKAVPDIKKPALYCAIPVPDKNEPAWEKLELAPATH